MLIQLRRDTAARWTAVNPVLASGEVGFETDTRKFKIGDGTTRWVDAPYFGAPLGDSAGLIVKTTTGGALTTLPPGTSGQFLQYDGTWGTPPTYTQQSLGVVSQTNGTVTTASSSSKVVRNITLSTSGPSGGSDGDVWMVYV